jgi:hypothetical protein
VCKGVVSSTSTAYLGGHLSVIGAFGSFEGMLSSTGLGFAGSVLSVGSTIQGGSRLSMTGAVYGLETTDFEYSYKTTPSFDVCFAFQSPIGRFVNDYCPCLLVCRR